MKPAPKRPDARARLLDHADAAARSLILAAAYPKSRLLTRNDLKTRRLLRAHERDIALRAAAIGANAASASDHRAVYDAIRAAILGPPRPSGRGKKGAKP